MKISDLAQFIPQPVDFLAQRQAAAVAGEVGVITAVEMRDGSPHVNVVFPVYGGEFTGIPAAELVITPAPVPVVPVAEPLPTDQAGE